MYNYRNALREQEVAHERAAYELLLTAFGGLNLAACEGVYEITVRSATQSVTVQVPFVLGGSIASELSSELEDRVVSAENRLNGTIEKAGFDVKAERNGKQARDAKHEENVRQMQAAYEAQQRGLAQMAAASATPPQKGPGRPRKARPEPALVGEVAGLAAAVPMNHGSTGHAVSRATNSPQG